LTGLVLYALSTGDAEVRETVEYSMRSHLDFMLPDGAWDNSFGTRNFKWTYWGSRTSDGCQVAYGLLGKSNPLFARAALENARLLARCTHDGFLCGGPDDHAHGEPPCVHHTLFHAKAFATLLDYGVTAHEAESAVPVQLPRETATGVRHYPEIDTYLVAQTDWRATVTGYDWEYAPASHASGGALSLLWHAHWGPVLCASLTQYELIEENNMQLPIANDHACLTPRLVYTDEKGNRYQSILDVAAQVSAPMQVEKKPLLLRAEGQLVNEAHKAPHTGKVEFTAAYTFTPKEVELSFTCTRAAQCIFPVLAQGAMLTREDAFSVCFTRGEQLLRVVANHALVENASVFNLVPGFAAIPLTASVTPGEPLRLTLTCSETQK
ncbi:MAG: hypothetical protein RR951_09980, partial [Ruthenibacterium sp.]